MNNQDKIWQDFEISQNDLNTIFTHLLETETPATHLDLARIIIINKIEKLQKDYDAEQKNLGDIYYPKDIHQISDILIFPHFSWKKGKVVNIRQGENPDFSGLQVLEVEFDDSSRLFVAGNIPNHKLNQPINRSVEAWLDVDKVISKYNEQIALNIKEQLDHNEDLVRIAGHYFPSALLVDIGIGQLNLCEAILEMENGGPLPTQELLSQIEIPSGVNSKLIEFSLDYALQEDPRFDEVGPAGKTLWFLNRLEPEEVRNTPYHLQFSDPIPVISDDIMKFRSLGTEQCDELENDEVNSPVDTVILSLPYPHWRSGTLPLTSKLKLLFPTAYETPRIKFNFHDLKNNSLIPGWVVRSSRYIYGLRDWYIKEGVIPGSLIIISKSKNPGEVNIKVDKAKNSKEWIKTVLVGADGGIVFALLKQVVTCSFDDRMALVTPDIEALDIVWEKKLKNPIEKIIHQTMIDLSRLNPQNQIHAQELYAAVNVTRRCPPSVILDILFDKPWVKHLGDMYFKLTE
jgi:hypothetical protein